MGALARWRALAPRQRWTTVRVAPAVGAAVLRVRLFGVRHALAWAEVRPRARQQGAAADIAAAVDRAARYLPGASCLPRSIALARVLRKRGVPAMIRIGVETDPGFAAHAWVEVDGVPLADAPARFTPMPIR